MSIGTIEKLKRTNATESYYVNKLVVGARMLSGRLRWGSLVQHFSPSETGICKLCKTETEDIEHILLQNYPPLLEKKPQLLQYGRETTPDSLKISKKLLVIQNKKFNFFLIHLYIQKLFLEIKMMTRLSQSC